MILLSILFTYILIGGLLVTVSCFLIISQDNPEYLIHHTVSVSPFCWGEQLVVPNFEKVGSEKKNECPGGLNEFLPWIFARGTSYISCQKRLKIKYDFEGSISNVDLSLF